MTDSTTESKYIAALDAAKEDIWLKKFTTGLNVVWSINPVDLYCDNNGAIAQAKEPRSHQRTNHILRRYHLIREIVERGDVKICWVDTNDNVADPLTKALLELKHERHVRSLGIRFMHDWLAQVGDCWFWCSSPIIYVHCHSIYQLIKRHFRSYLRNMLYVL